MEGLLIFAGLFSASLTAFLIESYRSLTPDQGAIAIAVLAQISLQLDPNSDIKSGAIVTSSFTPSTSSLACNTLWFLSLGLSLCCALIATLVDQWARDFIQRTEMRPSPVIRARIFSYLYFGIQRFGMHTVVEFIPFLLHLSLLFFFGGLVAFLLPINRALMVLVAALLCLISATYIYLTLLPILSSDSPYRTPVTRVAWEMLQRASVLFRPRKRRSSSDEESSAQDDKHRRLDERIPTMVEVMILDAVAESSKRHMRDSRAIVWTVRSLGDNNELENFVVALPDLIWGPDGRRRGHDQMISMLLDSPDVQLVRRIEGLLRSCDSHLLHQDLEIRRRVHYIKAFTAFPPYVDAPTSTLIDICRHAAIFGYLRLRHVDHGPSAPLIDVRLRSATSGRCTASTRRLRGSTCVYCTISTECSAHVTCYLKCSLSQVFRSRLGLLRSAKVFISFNRQKTTSKECKKVMVTTKNFASTPEQ
ncbi:hypothetical protein B0H14DRAFT_3172724 [Mycena olivaceomarginata]|nr:hypothetical protein B0H14DRAFT_3172724 [Mycena olivaceomarginata]